jgi:hypothetical protein
MTTPLEGIKRRSEYGFVMDSNSNYALIMSCNKGYTEVGRQILKYKNKVHRNYSYYLCLASENGHLEVVRLLLEHDDGIRTGNNYALCEACKNGHIEVVKLLVSKGYYHSSADTIITKNFYDWMQEFPIHLDFKRTEAMEEGERRYLANENWIKGNRRPNYVFSDITIIVN